MALLRHARFSGAKRVGAILAAGCGELAANRGIKLPFHSSCGESCGTGVVAQFKTTTKHAKYTKAIGLGR